MFRRGIFTTQIIARLVSIISVETAIIYFSKCHNSSEHSKVSVNQIVWCLHCITSRYRINNPGRVAEVYCGLLKSCLEVDESWGSAANALEYAVRMRRITCSCNMLLNSYCWVEVKWRPPRLKSHLLWASGSRIGLRVVCCVLFARTVGTVKIMCFSVFEMSWTPFSLSSCAPTDVRCGIMSHDWIQWHYMIWFDTMIWYYIIWYDDVAWYDVMLCDIAIAVVVFRSDHEPRNVQYSTVQCSTV